jgi:hypothetical protein
MMNEPGREAVKDPLAATIDELVSVLVLASPYLDKVEDYSG